MNDYDLDAKIIAAANRRSDETNTFTKSTMQRIKLSKVMQNSKAPNKWFGFKRHKIAASFLALAVISTVLFSSYAYAIGSDPISLIKRWVEGDKVKIEYQGRQFEHGKTRNYSDAAVTALAEINTVQSLAFHAKNALQVPKDGIEYVSLAPSMNPAVAYQDPYLAKIESVNDDFVTVHKLFLWGNKMNPSRDLDEAVNIAAQNFKHFTKGEPTQVSTSDIGKLIMVDPDTSLRHEISSNQVTRQTNYFSFELSHELESFKQVAITGAIMPGEDMVIFEPNWGGLSDICMNNGADKCNPNVYHADTKLEGLFVHKTKFILPGDKNEAAYFNSNPSAIAYGEGVASNDVQPENLISRNLMGEIVEVNNDKIKLKTSSGTVWTLDFTKQKQDAFNDYYKNKLKVGDKVTGQILESVYNLNNKEIKNEYISSLARY